MQYINKDIHNARIGTIVVWGLRTDLVTLYGISDWDLDDKEATF